MLRLTVADLAKQADVSPNTLVRIEAEKPVNTSSVKAVQNVLEQAGVKFQGEHCVCLSEAITEDR